MLLSFTLSVQDCWWTWQHGNIRSLTTRGAICPHPIDHCALDAVCNVVQHLYKMAKGYVPGSVSILQFSTFTNISSSVECRMPKVTIAGGPERSKASDGFYNHHNHMQSLFEAIVVGLALLGMLVRALESIFILHFFYIPSEFFRHFPCAAHHFLKIWMCQDLHERQQAFVFGGGVYFDCLSPNVLDSRRSAINTSSMKFHEFFDHWLFCMISDISVWMFVVFAGHFCPDLVYCGGYGMGVWDLGRSSFSNSATFMDPDAIFQLLRIGPIEVIALIVFIGYAWSLRNRTDGCRYVVENGGHIQLEMYLRGCDLFVTHRPQVDLDEFCYDVCICSMCKYIQGNYYYVYTGKLLVSKYASIIQSIQSCIAHDHNRCAVHHCLSHEFHSAKSESFLLQVW